MDQCEEFVNYKTANILRDCLKTLQFASFSEITKLRIYPKDDQPLHVLFILTYYVDCKAYSLGVRGTFLRLNFSC